MTFSRSYSVRICFSATRQRSTLILLLVTIRQLLHRPKILPFAASTFRFHPAACSAPSIDKRLGRCRPSCTKRCDRVSGGICGSNAPRPNSRVEVLVESRRGWRRRRERRRGRSNKTPKDPEGTRRACGQSWRRRDTSPTGR